MAASRGRGRCPVRTSRLRPASRDPSSVVRQPPEGRPDPSADERSGAAHPGRADEWPRSARPADVLRAGRRDPGSWADRAPVVTRAAGGRADLRPRRDHPRREARCRGADRRSPNPGHRHLEIEFCRDVPSDVFDHVAGVRDLTVDCNVLRCTVIGAVDPILKAANRYEVRMLTSSEPSLEEVFLEQYGGKASDAA